MTRDAHPSSSHAAGRVAVAAAVVVLIIGAVAAYLYLEPQSSASTPVYSFTNYSGSTSLITISTSISTPANAVQVVIPDDYWGEIDDGAINFLPQVVTVVIGLNSTVTWTNQDYIAHNVISDTGAFYSGDLSHGQTYTFTFTQPGTYPYYCSYHPMNGVVIVENP